MTYRSTEPPTARRQLAHVLRFARTTGIWRRDGNTWTDGGTTEVSWDPERHTLHVSRPAPFTNRHCGADVDVSSILEALDVLAALHALPQFLAPTYRDGVHTGTVTAQRVAHEHYNQNHRAVVRDLEEVIVDLGVFVDDRHQYNRDGCDTQPGTDCEPWCAACKALADLDGEWLQRIRDERAVTR